MATMSNRPKLLNEEIAKTLLALHFEDDDIKDGGIVPMFNDWLFQFANDNRLSNAKMFALLYFSTEALDQQQFNKKNI